MSKRILIRTETSEIVILRHADSQKFDKSHCVRCGAAAEMLTIGAAIDMSGIPASEIIRQAETGVIHASKTPIGHLMICGISLTRYTNEKERSHD